jgi:diguanylate cyclase
MHLSLNPTSQPAPAADAASAQLSAWMQQADPAGAALPPAACAAARQAQALAAQLCQPVQQARAAGWVCVHLHRMGRHAEMLAESRTALPQLVQEALAADRRELLHLLALSASEIGAYDQALDAAHELVRLTADLRDDDAALGAAYGLAVCFERMGDSWQATRLLSQALDQHGQGAGERIGMISLNALCAISIGLMHRLRGTGADDEVQAVLARARDYAERARALLLRQADPTYEVTILGNLGEVLVHQGELDAAEPLLLQSLALAVQRGMRAHAWRLRVSWGMWLLARGRPAEALDSMLALIDEAGELLPQQALIRARHVAYSACSRLQRFEEALAHFEIVELTERRRATAQLMAQSQLFVTRTETQQAEWRAEQARLDAARHSQRAAEWAESAQRDPLTGLGNRRHLDRRRAELLPQGQREQAPLVLALIDIDHFKAVNDRHGHATGDQVLVTLAQLLRENTRQTDVLTRYGGEEFLLLLPGMGRERATEFCERMRVRVAAYPWHTAHAADLRVTISIGLTAAPPYDWNTLLARADGALYAAKRGGRDRLVVA